MSDFPKNLLQSPSGFPELLPNEAIAQQKVIDVIRKHYERAGFVPIETPLVEREEVLTAKSEGEIGTQMYGLRLMNPAKDSPTDTKDLVLRYDHTVPMARFVAAHQREITFPFRRFAIGPVFRGERPREGRYRQFIQADIDVIGDGILDNLHDAEIVSVIANIFTELSIGDFTIRIGNRKLLQGILSSTGINDSQIAEALLVIDHMEKVSAEDTIHALVRCGMTETTAKDVITTLSDSRDSDEQLASLKERSLDELYKQGVGEIEALINGLRALGVSERHFTIDLSIARGLAYYTGNVFETRLDNHADIGSIASGGRYDDLASTFIDKRLPGVGISIGVSRILPRLIKTGLLSADISTTAPVIITTALPLEAHGAIYLRQAALLRAAEISTEVYLTDRALGKELEYANKRGFIIALITGEQELAKGTIIVRDLRSGNQVEVHEQALVETVRSMMGA